MNSEQAFLQAVEDATINQGQFKHIDHLRYAFLCLRLSGLDTAKKRVRRSLRHLTAQWGVGHKFHHTLTDALVTLIDQFANTSTAWPEAENRLEPLKVQAKDILGQYYTDSLLWSERAKTSFVAPDLKNFDGHCTIGQLQKQTNLSRSTILYYERQGLFKAASRTAAGYRLFDPNGQEQLKQILLYREAGLSVAKIKLLLSNPHTGLSSMCQQRLNEISQEMTELKQQRDLVFQLLGHPTEDHNILSKKIWSNFLRKAGLDEDGMSQWHAAFEAERPEEHQRFLESLGIDHEEITKIRTRSRDLTSISF